MKRPRSDSKLKSLPLDQQETLRDLMAGSNLSYRDIVLWLNDEWDIEVSLATLSDFWTDVCAPYVSSRLQESAKAADIIAASLEEHQFDEATRTLVSQMAFEFMSRPNAEPADVAKIFTLILKAQDQDLDRDKFEVMRKKAAQADKAKEAIDNTSLTPEEREERIRRALL